MTRQRNLHWTAMRTEPGLAKAGLKLSLQPCTVQMELRHPVKTGQHGTLKSSMCWPRWDSVWALGMCGGSHTFATKMEAVSVFKERVVLTDHHGRSLQTSSSQTFTSFM